MYLLASYILLAVSLLLFYLELSGRNRQLKTALKILASEHRRVFQEMIARVHHKGIVPISATSLGLANIISLELGKCLQQLRKLYETLDSQKTTITPERLKQIEVDLKVIEVRLEKVMTKEIVLLQFKLKELNEEIKRVVNEYDEHQ